MHRLFFAALHWVVWRRVCCPSCSVCANHKTSFSGCESWVNVEIGTVTYRNPGTLQEVAESPDAAPVALLRTNGSDATCENSLVEACYFFYYSPEGAITQVRGPLGHLPCSAATFDRSPSALHR